MSLVVLISGRGSNLQAILDAGLPVSAVISNKRDAGGLAIASARGVKTAVIEGNDYGTREGFDAALGDDIIFGHVAPPSEAPLQLSPAPRSYAPSGTGAPDMSVESAPANLGLVEVAAIAMAILVGIMFGWRLIRRRAEPTPHAKLFADQLRVALAEEDGHARNV